jgi:hypothetical protein
MHKNFFHINKPYIQFNYKKRVTKRRIKIVDRSVIEIDQNKKVTNKRLLEPDLARGLMLLLIALAHAPMYVESSGSGILSHPVRGTALDNVIKFVTIVFVDQRTYPMLKNKVYNNEKIFYVGK